MIKHKIITLFKKVFQKPCKHNFKKVFLKEYNYKGEINASGYYKECQWCGEKTEKTVMTLQDVRETLGLCSKE